MEYCAGKNLKEFIDKNIKNNELIEENILYNIIKQICIGIKEINNKFYIVMEFCAGNNLKEFIDKKIKNNELIEGNILYNIIKQICIGIKEIHNKIYYTQRFKTRKYIY